MVTLPLGKNQSALTLHDSTLCPIRSTRYIRQGDAEKCQLQPNHVSHNSKELRRKATAAQAIILDTTLVIRVEGGDNRKSDIPQLYSSITNNQLALKLLPGVFLTSQ